MHKKIIVDNETMPNRFLLYMDILGTQDIIAKNRSVLLVLKEIVDHFYVSNRSFNTDLREIDNDPETKYLVKDISPEISNFSDHIVISYPSYSSFSADIQSGMKYVLIQSLVKIAVNLHKFCLDRGVLMRGALTDGQLWHKGGNILGRALIDAYKMETKVAVYPRVVLSESIIKMLDENGSNCQYMCIKQDFDGMYFIDYLKSSYFIGVTEKERKSILTSTWNCINENLENNAIRKDISKLAKWRWVAIKFNHAVDYYNQKYKDEFDVPKFHLATTL